MYLLSKYGSLRSFGRWNGNSYHLSNENVFEKTEPTALIISVDQIREITNVTFRVLREGHVKYFDQNQQQEMFGPLLKHLLAFGHRSNNEHMSYAYSCQDNPPEVYSCVIKNIIHKNFQYLVLKNPFQQLEDNYHVMKIWCILSKTW